MFNRIAVLFACFILSGIGFVFADQKTMAESQSVAIAKDQSAIFVIQGTPTITITPTLTFTPTYTVTGTATKTYTMTAVYTSTKTYTPTSTLPYGTNTFTPLATHTFTETFTFTPTYTRTGTVTKTYTNTPVYTNTFTPTVTHTPTKSNTPYVAIQATDTPTYTGAQLTATFTPTPALETAKILSSVATPVATPVVTAITTPRAGFVTYTIVRNLTSTGTNPGTWWFFKGTTGYPTYKIGVGGGFSYLLYSDGGNRNMGIGLPGELASEISVTYYHVYWPYGITPPTWLLE